MLDRMPAIARLAALHSIHLLLLSISGASMASGGHITMGYLN
jgi:hypothetical protein